MPGTEALPRRRDPGRRATANDRLAAAVKAHPTRLARVCRAADRRSRRRRQGAGARGAEARLQGRDASTAMSRASISTTGNSGRSSPPPRRSTCPIYLHPREPHPDGDEGAISRGYRGAGAPAWGFAMETCTHFLRLMVAGLFDAHPKLTLILGHLGEGLPFWLGRLDDHTRGAFKRRGLKRRSTDYLRDNIGHHHERQFLHARASVLGHGARHRQRHLLGRLAVRVEPGSAAPGSTACRSRSRTRRRSRTRTPSAC